MSALSQPLETDRHAFSQRAGAPGESHISLRDLIVAQVREGILSGRYKPGERLVEQRLAEEYQVSRIPVRDALQMLQTEGLVILMPRRGARVAASSREETLEMIEVRAVLEGMNARLAARRRDPLMVSALQELLAHGRVAARGSDEPSLIRLNGLFHERLATAGSNRILANAIRSLRERTDLAFAQKSARRAEKNWEEHAAILEAVIAGDEELAALLAARHVQHAGHYFIQENAKSGETI